MTLERVPAIVEMWTDYRLVRSLLSSTPLPEVVKALDVGQGRKPDTTSDVVPLGRLLNRRLRLPWWQPLCLPRALVLYRMARRRGFTPQLVIGLPTLADSKDAHAWVEIDGRDVGPPPGGRGHLPLARYS